jgi:hypothetical protein
MNIDLTTKLKKVPKSAGAPLRTISNLVQSMSAVAAQSSSPLSGTGELY